jgi:FkbM family methyltransferase
MVGFLKRILSKKYKRSIQERLGVPSLHWSLQNLKQNGYAPLFVIDIGAYEGYWTKDFLEVFPSTKVLMIEAQHSKCEKLEQVCAEFSNVSTHIAVLSGEDGKEVYFHENETASHVTSSGTISSITINSRSLDAILQQNQLSNPDF